MEKLVYLLWGDGSPEQGDEVRDRLLTDAAPALVRAGAHAVTVNVHDGAAAQAPSPVPTPQGEDPHLAEVALWVDSYDRRAPVERHVLDVGLTTAGYLVVESLYEDYGTTPHAPHAIGPTANARRGSSPCRSSTGPQVSTTRPGSSDGTGRSRRCRASSNPGAATCATRWSAR